MIINGNNIEELKKFDDNYFDSIVTDPPYEIGFMGKSWDASGIANNPEMWSECLRVLKPGGYLLSFSATRTYHRMAVAIEDAGFEVRDMIEWVYGSGFPKSLNIGKAVDKIQGNEREVTGKDPNSQGRIMEREYINGTGVKRTRNEFLTKGTSEWEGWGTALKPAHEPICMARKPLSEKTVAENVLKYGTGGINIDESRVGTDLDLKNDINNRPNRLKGIGITEKSGVWKGIASKTLSNVQDLGSLNSMGRFPANLIHDNSEEVRECFPETKSGAMNSIAKANQYNTYGKMYERQVTNQASEGNASRFFKSIIYQAKASKSERNKGLEDFEDKERVDYGGFHSEKGLIENNRNPENRLPNKNNHPTVKPVALMEYLIKMVTPTNGIVLDPFMGSGSTGVACVLNDFEFVGIDLDKDYCEIARARIEGVKETQTKMF
jgi:DNA modification methylase